MGEVLQSVKIVVTLFAVDESRVSITVVGSKHYKSVAVGFSKVECYSYSLVKSNLVVEQSPYIVSVCSPVYFTTFHLYYKAVRVIFELVDSFSGHLSKGRRFSLFFTALSAIDSVGECIFSKEPIERFVSRGFLHFTTSAGYGITFLFENGKEVFLVLAMGRVKVFTTAA